MEEKNCKKNDKIYFKGFMTGIFMAMLCMFLSLFIMDKIGRIDLSRISTRGTGKYASLEKKIMKKVNTLELFIDEYFLDEIDEEKMADEVYKGVIKGLGDDYAAYYTAEEYKDIQEKTEGVFCGIGSYISADVRTGIVTIVQPMKGSPAEKSGVKAGDIIYAVDGKEVTGMEISKVQALVKGKKGSKVKLTLMRKDKKVEIVVTRDEIVEETVESRMLDGEIGYVQVTSFEQVTSKQFREGIEKLEKEGQKAMIVDLRNNGGGLLDTAVDMLDRILPEGVVVYSKDKSGKKQEYKASNPDSFAKPLVVLVNENSASASEVFSGAIQDKKAGTLIGTQTFGKGIVQGIFGLNDKSAIKMTTAKYYTPNGRNIHGKGLSPDVSVELDDTVQKLPDSGEKVDNQLKAAWDYLQKKVS